jgi:hypothetical protein
MADYARIAFIELETQRRVLYRDAAPLYLARVVANGGLQSGAEVTRGWLKTPAFDYATREARWLFEIAEQAGVLLDDVRNCSALVHEGVKFDVLGKGYPSGVDRKYRLYTRQVGAPAYLV